MSDIPQTPEAIAYALMGQIRSIESEKGKSQDREYLLSLYEECLKATTGKNRKGLTRAA